MDGSPDNPWETVAQLATRGFGVVSRAELIAAGYRPGQVRSWVDRGLLRPRHLGVYAVGSDALPREGQLRAALLACGSSAVISHHSAAALWGLLREPEVIHVTVATGATTRRSGIVLHRDRRLTSLDLAGVHGIAYTNAARTICDLTLFLPDGTALDLASKALRKRLVTLGELHSCIERRRMRTGAPRLAWLARKLDPDLIALRSWLERRFRRLCRDFGVPAYEANAIVTGFEVDCLWRDIKLVVELDGRTYHSDAAAFEGDHERDAALKAAGYEVFRITYRMLTETPERTMKQLKQLIRQRSVQADAR